MCHHIFASANDGSTVTTNTTDREIADLTEQTLRRRGYSVSRREDHRPPDAASLAALSAEIADAKARGIIKGV